MYHGNHTLTKHFYKYAPKQEVKMRFLKDFCGLLWQRSKLVRIVLIILFLLAAYLNIGWAIGTYYHNYIIGKTPQTFWQNVWSGGFNLFETVNTDTLQKDQIFFMFVWPIALFILLSWIVYGLWLFIYYYAFGVYCILWFIFAGGVAKLFGVG